MPAHGTIYIIQAAEGGPFKLGWSSKGNAEARLVAAQTYSPVELRIVVETPGTMAEEQALHRALDAYRLEGEWFTFWGEAAEFVGYLLEGGSVGSYLGR